MISVGIDISAKDFVMATRKNRKTLSSKTYGNDAKGIQAAAKRLRGNKPVQVCLEATGVYHLDAAIALSAVSNVELMVVNPKVAKRFAEALMQRTKTDKVDAEMLAIFSERMDFVAWRPPAKVILVLRACSRRLAALTELKVKAKNQHHALVATETTPTFVLDDALLTIGQFEQQIARLKQHTLDHIADDDFLAETLSLLLTVNGIAETTAIQLMGELLVLPDDMKNRQWVAMAGLDPRQFTSGSSVHKQTRISKAGNRFLRMALYMPALNAAHREPHISAYYTHLIEDNGLKKMQALCAVMRKLLHAVHAILKQREPFDGSKFYTIPKTQPEATAS
jgi:transposase